jgi:hypothetical protein
LIIGCIDETKQYSNSSWAIKGERGLKWNRIRQLPETNGSPRDLSCSRREEAYAAHDEKQFTRSRHELTRCADT